MEACVDHLGLALYLLVPEGRLLPPAADTCWFLQQASPEDSVRRCHATLTAANFSRNFCWEDPFSMVTVTLVLLHNCC